MWSCRYRQCTPVYWFSSTVVTTVAFRLPYERAIKHQAVFYHGKWQPWYIHFQPCCLLLLSCLGSFFSEIFHVLSIFNYYIITSCSSTSYWIRRPVLTLDFISLFITSLLQYSFVCPFHSSFSTIIRLILIFPLGLCRILSRQMGFEGRLPTISDKVSLWLLIGGFLGPTAVIGCLPSTYSGGIFTSIIILIFAYSTQGEAIKYKPQTYRLPLWSLYSFLFIGSLLSAAGYFSKKPFYNIVGMVLLLLFGWMANRLSKSMKDAGKIDAIAWLLDALSIWQNGIAQGWSNRQQSW